MKRPARVPSQLPELLHKRLNAYALAASAAGVSVLALTQAADAKIIYTPANIKIRAYHHYYLEINHDGVHDFEFFNIYRVYRTCGCPITTIEVIPREKGNQIWGGPGTSASALSYGVQIGSNSKLAASHILMWYHIRIPSNGTSRSHGQWKNADNRYLGLKFIVKGTATHYGWARLSLTTSGSNHPILTLTGYAYETIPNKPINAGQTHGEHGATLGRLAQGASGVVSRDKK